MTALSAPRLAVIGAGPAGLMAAEQIAEAGYAVEVFDAMPSVARKFLRAGIGGLNITHAENYPSLLRRFGTAEAALQPLLDDFPPQALREWIHRLGIETFIGSSQRVFPVGMKAAPLLRAWLQRLRQQGVKFHPRHRWLGWAEQQPQQGWLFDTPHGEICRQFDYVVLALGGGSWAKLGSDGRWCQLLHAVNIDVTPLKPSNCGFDVAWSDFIRQRYAGTPIKNVALSLIDTHGQLIEKKGELIISQYGLEGSLVYALSATLRDRLSEPLATEQTPVLKLDWLPHNSHQQIQQKLQLPRQGITFNKLLQKKLKLPAITATLLKECCPALDTNDAAAIANALKAMPLYPSHTRPLDEAISSAGGIRFSAVDQDLMLTALGNVFVAGEMLDWEAPTGGYLLTGCFATGKRAGAGVVRRLSQALGAERPA